jgi:hypothetical protein
MSELTLDSADGVDGKVGDEVSLHITGTITATGPDGVTVGEVTVGECDGGEEADTEDATESESEPTMPVKGKMPKAVAILMMGKPKK